MGKDPKIPEEVGGGGALRLKIVSLEERFA